MTRAGMPAPRTVRRSASPDHQGRPYAPNEQAHLCLTAPPLCSAATLATLPDDYVQNWSIRRAANSTATPSGRTCR
jgi:hypothetical protein